MPEEKNEQLKYRIRSVQTDEAYILDNLDSMELNGVMFPSKKPKVWYAVPFTALGDVFSTGENTSGGEILFGFDDPLLDEYRERFRSGTEVYAALLYDPSYENYFPMLGLQSFFYRKRVRLSC